MAGLCKHTWIPRAALVSTTTLLAVSAFADPAVEPTRREQSQASGVPTPASEPEALVSEAEGAARAGHLGSAWEILARAWKAAPSSPAPARAMCRLAILHGKQPSAEAACQRALVLGWTPEDMRNRVAAWVMGPAAPAMEDLMSASFMADGAVRVAPNQPWGYRARCDLALRLENREMLDSCIGDLKRVAPDSQEMKQALALGAARGPFKVWAGFLVVGFAVLSTVLHAFGRVWPRRGRATGTRTTTAPLAIVLILVWSGTARATPSLPETAGFSINDANPEASVPSPEKQLDNPMAFSEFLQQLIERAQASTKNGAHTLAARYYAALTKAVPQRAYAFGKLCDSLAASGDRDNALTACRTALVREGATVGDFTRFVRLLLAKSDPLNASERKQVDVAIAQVAKQPKATIVTEKLRCELALHENDLPALGVCSAKLAVAAPNDPKTISYEWALALDRRDAPAARRLVERARRTGVHRDVVAKMQEATHALGASRTTRAVRWALVGAGGTLLAALLVVASRGIAGLRRRRLAS
jgi:hypothetical protein